MLPGLADGTIDGESSSTGNKDSEARKDVEAIASSPLHGTGNTDSLPCGTLSKLPREVRSMIYTNVLVYEFTIVRPHRFLGRQPPILAKDSKYFPSIDAALLRTCKVIYHEAIRILYSKNRFQFCKPSDIEKFAHLGLGTFPFEFYGTTNKPSSPVHNAPYGRLTMIRLMTLRLSSKSNGDNLKKVWSFWSDFFYPPEKQDQLVGFPALERLALDFMDWDLTEGHASIIRVRPITHIFSHVSGIFGWALDGARRSHHGILLELYEVLLVA